MSYFRDIMTPRFLIALLILALFAGSIIVMSFISVPDANQEVVIQLIGGINTLAGLVIGFYFGNSANFEENRPAPVVVENTPDDPAIVQEA